MKTSAFWKGTLCALAISFFGSMAFSLLSPLLGVAMAARIVLVAISGCYLWVLIRKPNTLKVTVATRNLSSPKSRVGKTLALTFWCGLTLLLCLVNPNLYWWLLTLISFTWVIRSLFLYQNILASIGDGLLTGIAIVAALATAFHTQSMFFSLWAFFLTLALSAYLPGFNYAKSDTKTPQRQDRFNHAYQLADKAIRKMSTASKS